MNRFPFQKEVASIPWVLINKTQEEYDEIDDLLVWGSHSPAGAHRPARTEETRARLEVHADDLLERGDPRAHALVAALHYQHYFVAFGAEGHVLPEMVARARAAAGGGWATTEPVPTCILHNVGSKHGNMRQNLTRILRVWGAAPGLLPREATPPLFSLGLGAWQWAPDVDRSMVAHHDVHRCWLAIKPVVRGMVSVYGPADWSAAPADLSEEPHE